MQTLSDAVEYMSKGGAKEAGMCKLAGIIMADALLKCFNCGATGVEYSLAFRSQVCDECGLGHVVL